MKMKQEVKMNKHSVMFRHMKSKKEKNYEI